MRISVMRKVKRIVDSVTGLWYSVEHNRKLKRKDKTMRISKKEGLLISAVLKEWIEWAKKGKIIDLAMQQTNAFRDKYVGRPVAKMMNDWLLKYCYNEGASYEELVTRSNEFRYQFGDLKEAA